MSSMTAAREALRAEITTLDDRRARMAKALEALDEIDGASAPAPAPTPHRNGRVARSKPAAKAAKKSAEPKTRKAGRRSADPALLEKARDIAAKAGLAEAAKVTGLRYNLVWSRSKEEKWKVAKSPKGPARVKESGQPRQCKSCREMTWKDPCSHCGQPVAGK